MDCATRGVFATSILLIASVFGCASPYHADQGALVGGLGGAGLGAIAGHALGNTAAGAAIGAGVGALGGAAVGAQMDETDARNRQAIAAQMGRQVAAGAVSIEDVVAMSQARVNDELIVTHIRTHGMVRPLQTSDLISLQNQGVSTRVIQAMQENPVPVMRQNGTVVVHETAPPAVIVEPYPYDPWWGPPPPHYYHYYHHPHPGPRVGWGVTIGN